MESGRMHERGLIQVPQVRHLEPDSMPERTHVQCNGMKDSAQHISAKKPCFGTRVEHSEDARTLVIAEYAQEAGMLERWSTAGVRRGYHPMLGYERPRGRDLRKKYWGRRSHAARFHVVSLVPISFLTPQISLL